VSFSIDLSRLTSSEEIKGEDPEETALLKEMLGKAEAYLESQSWSRPISNVYFGCGVGGVVAVFLFEFEKSVNETDKWLWVVVGDVPSAYFVTDQAPDAAKALRVYCDLMQQWADAVLQEQPLENLFPVSAAPTKKHANMLLSRISFIREKIIPHCLK
jgi:hypothetical protein